MTIKEAALTGEIMEQMISLSGDWEQEGSCHGYRKNSPEDITATKNFRAILRFYIDELGMAFWSARLYKKIEKTEE